LQGDDQPSFTLDELKLINEVTRSSGRVMVCHAKSREVIKRSVLAGAETIEPGDFIDVETGKLMKEDNFEKSEVGYEGWASGEGGEVGFE